MGWFVGEGLKGARLAVSCVISIGSARWASDWEWELGTTANPEPMAGPGTGHQRSAEPSHYQVPVFYATDRAPLRAPGGSSSAEPNHGRHSNLFGQQWAEFGALSFGTATVHLNAATLKRRNIQDDHRRDSRRIDKLKALKDASDFREKLREAVKNDSHRRILVFVHGCFTDFQRGVEYAGLLKKSLDFQGPTIVFSWPSIGRKVQSRPYAKDSASSRWSAPHLKELLEMLLTEVEARVVHVLTYSMGSRLLVGAMDIMHTEAQKLGRLEAISSSSALLKQAAASVPAEPARLGHLIFMAPDEDVGDFQRVAKQCAESYYRPSLTLYISTHDWALGVASLVSGGAQGGPRVGQKLLLSEAYSTVDASAISWGSFNMGHHYLFNQGCLEDLAFVLSEREGPSPGRKQAFLNGRAYWKIYPHSFAQLPLTEPLTSLPPLPLPPLQASPPLPFAPLKCRLLQGDLQDKWKISIQGPATSGVQPPEFVKDASYALQTLQAFERRRVRVAAVEEQTCPPLFQEMFS